jgi:hypothetical protein
MMSRLLRLTILLGCLLAATSALANTCTTCYIDYENGDDSNNGADTAHPWKHMPGMTGGSSSGSDSCMQNCASQTPKAGDRYILKGGVVWPSTVFPLKWSWKGTSTTSGTYGCAGTGCIYVGVDNSWNKGIVNSVVPSKDYGGCSTAVSVSIAPSEGGTTAAATPVMVGRASGFGNGGSYVGYYKVTSQGSGYTSNPTVQVTGPGCVNSQAVADIERAVFDFGGTSGVVWNATSLPQSSLVYLANSGQGDFTIWDSIEMRHAAFDKASASTRNVFQSDNATNVTANNLFIHDWGIITRNTGGGDGSYAIYMVNNNGSTPHEEISNSWVNNAERIINCTIGTPTQCSEGNVAGGGTMHHNHLMYYVWMFQGTKNVHDNEAWGNTASDNGGHTNMFYLSASPNDTLYVYNNLFHDNDHGSSSQMSQGVSTTWYVFNNVCWLCGAGGSIFGIDTNNPTPSGNTYFYFWSNTLNAQDGASSCINAGGAGAPYLQGLNVSLYNNVCITTQSSNHWWSVLNGQPHTVNGVASPSMNTPDSANVAISPSAAASQGYTIANRFQPPSSGAALVASSGANLTSTTPGCGTVPALCLDIMGNSRPAVGSWNAGAYVFRSGTPPVAPTALIASPH